MFEDRESGDSFEEDIELHMQPARKYKIFCTREERYGKRSKNEKI